MCGVIGLIFQRDRADLGEVAARLLGMLEYRGYDSTGAVIQDETGRIDLRKDVGAPSTLVKTLGIDRLAGSIFCGQVRWATFGMVTKANAQPHQVACKIGIYGAHNGNITNCHRLKDWLMAEGHDVKSDNDGEMVVHTVEHYFALELAYQDDADPKVRETALRRAVVKAAARMVGSFAAVVVDPVSRTVVAIKAGSSLYLGTGEETEGGRFVIASSDLASVLQLTRILLPIREREFAVFHADRVQLYDLRTGRAIRRQMQRSLLRVEETRLQPQFQYFMEQEIHQQVAATGRLVTLYQGGDEVTRLLRRQRGAAASLAGIRQRVQALAAITEPDRLRAETARFARSKLLAPLVALAREHADDGLGVQLSSSHASFLEELRDLLKSDISHVQLVTRMIDAAFDLADLEALETRIDRFVALLAAARERGNTVWMLACGSSFHAAKTAPLFFDEIAAMPIIPLLPGEFRAQCLNSLRPGDVVIGISQSGETKDLIDVFNLVARRQPKVERVCILNNTNSTLAIEKSDLFIPLMCGPEIAVPATKSFVNQLLVLLLLAMRLREYTEAKAARARRRGKTAGASAEADDALAACRARHLALLSQIPGLIDRTIKTTRKEIETVAAAIYQQPSVHILATRILGIAKEGALKIREIVLNHTEGFEGSEFKHGPNTILGVNTVFGLDSVRAILRAFSDAMASTLETEAGRRLDGRGIHRLYRAVTEFAFSDVRPDYLSPDEMPLFDRIFARHNFFNQLYSSYPLIFIACPDETDIHLTISQINTHKIRGANVYMIAEDHDLLREAVSLPPAGAAYDHGYITLPRTGSTILSIFSITVVLQLLALAMSRMKLALLDRLEIADHGVHPDVPKNVSKSITVD